MLRIFGKKNKEQTVVKEAPDANEPVVEPTPQPTIEPSKPKQSAEPKEKSKKELKAEIKAAKKASLGTSSSEEPKKGFFKRIRTGLSKTRSHFGRGVSNMFLGRKEINDELFEELETTLLTADIGYDVTKRITNELVSSAKRRQLKNPEALFDILCEKLTAILEPCEAPLTITKKPAVILMIGVNGAGKTTTIGKLAKQFQNEDKKVMLAAGDTFRAAAIEQLTVWGERNNIEVIAQQSGSDSASVVYDAVQSAQARQVDVLIADTAGRLHTQDNLMAELKKVKRVMSKLDEEAPHETLLVLDASTGQNALRQAEEFNAAIDITGIVVTKLDGTARGGILYAIADKLKKPIRYIGVGEGIDDLRPFNAKEFTQAIFSNLKEEEVES